MTGLHPFFLTTIRPLFFFLSLAILNVGVGIVDACVEGFVHVDLSFLQMSSEKKRRVDAEGPAALPSDPRMVVAVGDRGSNVLTISEAMMDLVPNSNFPVLAIPLDAAIEGKNVQAPYVRSDNAELALERMHLFVNNWCNRQTREHPFVWAGQGSPAFPPRIDTIIFDKTEFYGHWDCHQELADCLARRPKSMQSWWMTQLVQHVIEVHEAESKPITVHDDEEEGGFHMPSRWKTVPAVWGTPETFKNNVAMDLDLEPQGGETAQRKDDTLFLRRVVRGEDEKLDFDRLWTLLGEQGVAPDALRDDWRLVVERGYAEHRAGKERPLDWKARVADLSAAARAAAADNFQGTLKLYLQQNYQRGFARVRTAANVGEAWQWHPAMRKFTSAVLLKRGRVDPKHGRVIPDLDPNILDKIILPFVAGKPRVKLLR
jgi:hypothetical protein